ncbi:hypothetical protein Tco_1285885 [Tanacetum coccineum]
MMIHRYVTESDPEEDPEEYEDDETEDGPVDYPIGGDDGDDDDGDSSRDDADDEDEEEEEETMDLLARVDVEERQTRELEMLGRDWDNLVDRQRKLSRTYVRGIYEVNTRVTELAELHERDTLDLYALLEDAQDSRSCISQRFDMDSRRVDLLMGVWMGLLRDSRMVKEEAMFRETQLQLQSTLFRHKSGYIETSFMIQSRVDKSWHLHQLRTNTHLVNDTNQKHDPESNQANVSESSFAKLTNGDGSHSSHGDTKEVQKCWPCFYADFMKCPTFDFKGTEGVVINETLGPEDRNDLDVLKEKDERKVLSAGEIKKLEIELWN